MDSKKDNTASTPFVDLYERAMSSAQKNLMASYQGDLQTVVRSAAWSSVFAAVKAGVGVGILPTFLGESDASLERWNNAHTRVPIWLVMHPDLAKSARVRAFIEFLTQMMDEF
jgi:DNA-binding transcriptional LysR family regulator